MNPLQLARSLIKSASDRGARLFSNTEAKHVSESARRVQIQTASGNSVTARWAVVASGYEARSFKRLVKLKSTYALVSRPVRQFDGWHERCLIWETGTPYFYLRTTPDNRLMIGGADEDFCDPDRRDRLMRGKAARLGRKLKQLFPRIPVRPAFTWAGTFAETPDSLPYIGRAEPRSRILHALCYGANGSNFAMLASEILRDLILGRRNSNAALFAFDR